MARTEYWQREQDGQASKVALEVSDEGTIVVSYELALAVLAELGFSRKDESDG